MVAGPRLLWNCEVSLLSSSESVNDERRPFQRETRGLYEKELRQYYGSLMLA